MASLQEGLGQYLTESGKCSRGEACKTQNRFGFVLKYCCLHRESKKGVLNELGLRKAGYYITITGNLSGLLLPPVQIVSVT